MTQKLKKVDIENYRVKRIKAEQYLVEKNTKVNLMYDRLIMVAMSVFTWENLPPKINPLFLERTLLTHGSVLFFDMQKETIKDNPKISEEGYFIVTRYMPSYRLDYYGDPIVRRAYTVNGVDAFREDLVDENSVIIYDNILKTTFSKDIYDFAVHLTDIKSVIEQNIYHQKRPYIVGVSEEMQKSIQELFSQANDGKPYIILKDKFGNKINELISVFGTNVDLVVNELQDYYDAVWNEFMVMVGVGTNASPKRERLVAEEVSSVNQQSQVFAETRLRSRERACDMINEMYGLNVSVKYNFGGDDSGTVHNIDVERP